VLAADPPIVEDALFHCQQAAEKAMKAFLTAHDRPFHKTHDLDELASACEAIVPELRDALDPARELSVFAWHFRYPGEVEVPEPGEAHGAIRTARRVCEAIESRLLS
jgi:HEPN domain-containing protein